MGEDQEERRSEKRRAEDSKPKMLPPWGFPLLILTITLAVGSATYNFLTLAGKHDALEILSKGEFEASHLYQLKNDIQVTWLREKVVKAETDQENTLRYLRALAARSQIKVKEKE